MRVAGRPLARERFYNGVMSTPIDDALRTELETGLRTLGLSTDLATPLLAYLALLLRWNNTYNLTAVRDPREMVVRHLLDSLAMAPHVEGLATLADLGTGPGLPGIPLAIALPGLHVTLVESNGKKARFMREAIRQLKLPNAEVAESRIEAVDRPGAFDAITARALATLPDILAFGGHLPKADGGRLLAMKGVDPVEEIAALPPGWRVESNTPLDVPGLDAERRLVVVVRT